MKPLMIAAALFLVSPSSVAQQAPADSIPGPWRHSLVSALTFTQVSYTNWVQGGQSSLAYTVAVDGKSDRNGETVKWSSAYKLAFGQARLSGQGLRKTEDRIDLQSVLSYNGDAFLNPYAAMTLKTQFAEGIKYDAAGQGTVVSKFFDPAYITQSAGMGYQPIPEIKQRLGIALREVVTSQYTVYSDNPTTSEIERIKVDGGIESVTEAEWKLDTDVLLRAKLELFAPIKKPVEVVIRGDNTLTIKVGKFLTVNLNVQFINERQVSPRTQVKETLAIGLSYALL